MSQNKNNKHCEDISCIIDSKHQKNGIYISNVEAARNLSLLQKLNIQAIVTASKGCELHHPQTKIPYYLYLPGIDHENFNISEYFQEVGNFIQVALQKTNVLIHCRAGISRSAALLIAYLIKNRGYTLENAYKLLKSRRKIVAPNSGFMKQLKIYEKFISRIQIMKLKTLQNKQNEYNCKQSSNNRLSTDCLELGKKIQSAIGYTKFLKDFSYNIDKQRNQSQAQLTKKYKPIQIQTAKAKNKYKNYLEKVSEQLLIDTQKLQIHKKKFQMLCLFYNEEHRTKQQRKSIIQKKTVQRYKRLVPRQLYELNSKYSHLVRPYTNLS